ncbi:hypothetical protein IFM89_004732 [Coptis chinensis]|uniref:Sugar phosphate transporter domain-containing protein n=1 Tax=Coptis chinensis TaxID=261450 RepID=A0A835LB04_9MAGN|nr:hypothetical protein IFM89_004732 [Coptis chinensis]
MLESNLDEHIEIEKGSDAPVLRREPSFSRWCDKDGIAHAEHDSDNTNESVEDSDFELPLLQSSGIENNKFLNGARLQFTRFNQRSMDLNGDTQWIMQRHDDGSSSRGNDDTETDTESPVSLATVLKTLFFILVWYNKTLLGDKLGKFPAPLLMNTVHFAMQAVLSKGIMLFWSQRFQPKVTMSWRDYYMRVVPTALGTALDINLSNASLVFISVTFATMCKSAAPIFLLLFAFAFKLENPSFKLLGIMLVISAGILLTVAKETEFEFWGFIFVMLAAVMSGFRWSMTQILLQVCLKDPITLMSYVTPVMAVATALLSLFLDPWDEFRRNIYFNSSWHVLRSCLLMFIGGTLAFFMVLTEYILVSATSAVTVTIAGVVKEAVTILVAVFYFHDQFTWLKGIGLSIIMVGVSLFNWYKYEKLKKKGQMSENDESGPSTTNAPAKYVILEEMDDQDDEA